MNTIEEIIALLLLLGPDDFENAKKYLAWMQVRRRINNQFYYQAHWIQPPKHIHWIGQR